MRTKVVNRDEILSYICGLSPRHHEHPTNPTKNFPRELSSSSVLRSNIRPLGPLREYIHHMLVDSCTASMIDNLSSASSAFNLPTKPENERTKAIHEKCLTAATRRFDVNLPFHSIKQNCKKRKDSCFIDEIWFPSVNPWCSRSLPYLHQPFSHISFVSRVLSPILFPPFCRFSITAVRGPFLEEICYHSTSSGASLPRRVR